MGVLKIKKASDLAAQKNQKQSCLKTPAEANMLCPFSPAPSVTSVHVPGLHSAGAAAGAFVLPYVPADSAGLSPHPVPLLGGFPHAEVPLSTAAEGDDGSPQEASVFVWTLGISPQPAEARGRREEER